MTYEEKLSAATELIKQHNQNTEAKVDPDEFINKLKAMGGTTDAGLRVCSYEDLAKCGPPTILARLIANTFRSGGYSDTAVATKRQIETMSIEDLLAAYDPQEPDSRVAKRLKTMTADKKCIVFQGSNVYIEPSARLVRELCDGLPEIALLSWGGDVFKTHRIGERPARTFDENPLYPGQPLRGGVCGITGLDWTGIPISSRRIIYLAVTKTGELQVTPGTAEDVQRWARSNVTPESQRAGTTLPASGFEPADLGTLELRRRLRRAAVLYDDLAAIDSLPSLKINPSASAGEKIPGWPQGRKVV